MPNISKCYILCLFVNFYEYLFYFFEVDGVPIVVIELWFIFILI